MLPEARAFRGTDGRGLRKLVHCSCGHIVAFHDPQGCSGVMMRGQPCDCTVPDAVALDAAIRSFDGSRTKLRRRGLRLAAPVSVRRAPRADAYRR
jgi:hypothetical protein